MYAGTPGRQPYRFCMNAAEANEIVACPDGNASLLLPFGESLSITEFNARVPSAARPSDFVSDQAPCSSCLLNVSKYALAGSASIKMSACLSLSELAWHSALPSAAVMTKIVSCNFMNVTGAGHLFSRATKVPAPVCILPLRSPTQSSRSSRTLGYREPALSCRRRNVPPSKQRKSRSVFVQATAVD